MNAPDQKANELHLDNPLSPQEFGRWVFHDQKPLQRLAAFENLKLWQLGFFAGWESHVRQAHLRSGALPPPACLATPASKRMTKGKQPPRPDGAPAETKVTSASRERLIWEITWVPCEIAMVSLALILLLAVHFAAAGYLVLVLGVVVSLSVRSVHYSAATHEGRN